MKVLYIGCYRDGGGWCRAAIAYMLSLDAVGIEVVARPLKLSALQCPPPEKIIEFEARSASGADVVIQHVLPNLAEYSGAFKKNIISYSTETSHFRNSNWPERINIMDMAFVVNNQMKDSSLASHVKIPIKVITHAIDITRFERSYIPIQGIKDAAEGNFIFYTVGNVNRRKNLAALVRAFHAEFDPYEPVSLLIKTQKYNTPAEQAKYEMQKFCAQIKNGLRRFNSIDKYKEEIIICDALSEEDLFRLHSTCDCFVQPSYGEAYSYPAADAMAMGKTPIVSNWGGYAAYMNNDCGWMVDCTEDAVFGMNDHELDYLYIGNENWGQPNVAHLRSCMREAYENKELRIAKSEAGIARAYDFTYDKIGQQMKEAICHEENSEARVGGTS